jgi:hypothetical protein
MIKSLLIMTLVIVHRSIMGSSILPCTSDLPSLERGGDG